MTLLFVVGVSLVSLSILGFSQRTTQAQKEKDELLEKANLWLDMREFEQAFSAYTQILALDPKKIDIRKKMAQACFGSGKNDTALDLLRTELRLFPENGDAYDLMIFHSSRLDRISPALDFLSSNEIAPPEGEAENPNSGLGDFILGTFFKEKKDFTAALSYFNRALRRGYDPIMCNTQLADLEMILGKQMRIPDLELVEKVYQHLKGINEHYIELYSDFPAGVDTFETFFLKGLLYHNLGYTLLPNVPVSALSLFSFEQALSIKPESRDTLFNLACISYNARDFESAAQHFERLLEKHPEDEEAMRLLDCCLKRRNRLVPSEFENTTCPRKLDLAKNFIDEPKIKDYQYQFHNDLSVVFQSIETLAFEFIKKGDFDAAIQRYKNGLRIDEDSPHYNYNLGMIYFWKKDFDDAEQFALRALRREYFFSESASFIIKAKYGEKYLNKRDAPRKPHPVPLSQWTFEEALKKGNYFLEAYDLIGNIYFGQNMFDRAILAYEKVLDINNGDAMGHYNLGCVFEALNQFDNAENEWKKAIRFDKETEIGKNRTVLSEDDLAIDLTVTRRWISYRSHLALGKLYFQNNLLNRAEKEFQKAVKFQPNYPDVYLYLGKISRAKNDRDKEHHYFDRYLSLGGDESKINKKKRDESLKRRTVFPARIHSRRGQ